MISLSVSIRAVITTEATLLAPADQLIGLSQKAGKEQIDSYR